MKSINFEEHYVVDDIQKETMKYMSSDPNGVPMQTMLKGLEQNQALRMQMTLQNMMSVSNSWMNMMLKCKYCHMVMVHLPI